VALRVSTTSFRLFDDGLVVVARVVGNNDDRIVLLKVIERRAGHIQTRSGGPGHGGKKGSL